MGIKAWYPGHMSKTFRILQRMGDAIDLVVEVVDARAPLSSRHPRSGAILPSKPRVLVLSKADLAEPPVTRAWEGFFKSQGILTASGDLRAEKFKGLLFARISNALAPKVEKERKKGIRATRNFVVIGMPNVGKSTLINRLLGRRKAQTGAVPGITRGVQKFKVAPGLYLLDTPGVLYPEVRITEKTALLGVLGIIPVEFFPPRALLEKVLEVFRRRGKLKLLEERYGVKVQEAFWEEVARKAGILKPGGEPDLARLAIKVVSDLNSGLVGRISIETPEDVA